MPSTTPSSKRDFDLAIIGGGISGQTLAIALHTRGLRVKIYEQAPSFGEVGAGVAFTGNAVQSMKHCYSGIYEAFEKVRTGNIWDSKKKVWFDYHDGFSVKEGGEGTWAFSIVNQLGQAGVHRARYLDELVKLIPEDVVDFGRRLEGLGRDKKTGRHVLHFHDGSTATATAVIGCDGIKSKVRSLMYGPSHPCSKPTYSHKYAYRALATMEDAVKAVGEEKAKNACMHMGPGGHMLTFPVNHGKTLNIVAFHTTDDEWPDDSHLTRPAKREDALKDFEGYGSDVRNLLELCQPNLDVWAIFHLGDNPVPKYNYGSVLLIGDAAHATSPHHGAGAGFCIEDSAVLADLLADERVKSQKDIAAAFETFDQVRRERGNWLVQTSQHIGNCYEWLAEGVGEDFKKIKHEIDTRNGMIADVDVASMCREAKQRLGASLAASGKL
ncbi:FAD-dependent monooxygenase orf3 [Fulvia fulva]|uniref:FAD-dependent monooxygenase orf3 n=1 Tax=Passalora fulva TaxID=5499 RepID=A0A9Q8URJ4_PASFU|nr:FAD-dependent monooxygenase orf3 [Fulvia fulva]UJO19782.1 FAD-dependent monooxygenase orf3 [Fulvia fulva]